MNIVFEETANFPDSYTNPKVISRYSFYRNGNKIIAVTKDEYGRTFRGIAACSPEDEFDEEIGRKLAFLRCEVKVKRAAMNEALERVELWSKHLKREERKIARMEKEEQFWHNLFHQVNGELVNFVEENHLSMEENF